MRNGLRWPLEDLEKPLRHDLNGYVDRPFGPPAGSAETAEAAAHRCPR